ncbi:MAG TPA: hypothetical protein VFO41_00725 [Alphaproteobacteria bacterium]|nr:hypothetical protein [Alphaproteobacteria bacterium]
MARMAALDGGTYYHDESLRGQRFRGYFERTIYLPDLAQAPLGDLDALIVTCRSNPDFLRASADRLRNFLESGKTLVAMGECEAHTWLPLDWTPTPTNFWWWLDSGADPGLRIAAHEHPLFRTMSLADATWHHHGFFRPASGAVSLIDRAEGGSILLEDKANFGPGRLIAMTLDPFYHHGSFFMPAATRFLDKFLPWLSETLDEGRTK